MKSIQKPALLTAIFVLCFFGFSFAHDCKLASLVEDATQTKSFSFVSNIGEVNYEGIFTEEALAKAIENLKKYCCKEVTPGEPYCKNVENSDDKKYPQSAFLYDHLVDVAFRRLDGRSDLAYNLEPDEKGKKRRELFNGFATKKIASSTEIAEAYKEYRTRKEIIITDGDALDEDLLKFIKNFNTATLADKYINICPIINNLYNGLKTDTDTAIDASSKSYNAKCLKLANNRIAKEYIATQALMIKAANESLHATTQAYTMKYFMQEKMADLLTVINKLRGLFSTLAQQAPTSTSASK